ncbi:hypothetical protein [Isachenkonia alkalipeptolytica]|uniref:Uncharacterized protein n=1 Tax=Isachenkonia alkalipeptolytica TaxID=2565777 RepID=A0AA43XLR7_9CLOT|nr:hypothetical protein [Isachenkonia alkalipeptolytica]NBG88624.1 hypothetical protein [Isachenkonia alkalipeptolytica]
MEDFEARVLEEFSEGLESAEKEDYITKVSYEDITIDGHQGKTLQLDVDILQGIGEILYQDLSEELSPYDEVQDFISDYQDPESFTEAITENEELQQELLALLTDLESESPEPEQSLSLARARVEQIKALLSEDTSIEQRQKISIIPKENLVFRVYFLKDPAGYEDMIDEVLDLMDTIEFVE